MYVVLTPLLAFCCFRLRIGARGVGRGCARRPSGSPLLAGVHGGSAGGDLLVLGGGRGLLAPDRPDGALRAALRPARLHAARAARRLRACSACSPSPTLAVPHGWTVWGALLVTGIFASALGFLVQTWAQRSTSATRTALVFTLEPVWAAIFGFWLAGDRLGRGALGRLRGDHGRDPARGACLPAPSLRRLVSAAEAGVSPVLLALASAASFGAMTVAIRARSRPGRRARRRRRSRRSSSPSRSRSPPRSSGTTTTEPGSSSSPGCSRPALSQLLFTPVDPRGRRLAHLGHGRRGAALRARDRLHLPRRARPRAARRRRPRDRRRRRPARRPSATGPSTCAPAGSSSRSRAAVLFAVRDNIVRALHAHGSPETVAAATMLAGVARLARSSARRLPSARDAPPARARRACSSASPTSASSRPTSAVASRSSRRWSRPSRSGASGSPRSSSRTRERDRARGSCSGRSRSSPAASLIGLAATG